MKTLSYVQPTVIAAVDGATSPNPGEDGVLCYSTSGYLIFWDSTKWVKLSASTVASNKETAVVTLQDEPQSVVVPATWATALTDFSFSFVNPDPYPDELLLASPVATVESIDPGVSVTVRVMNNDGIIGDINMIVYER